MIRAVLAVLVLALLLLGGLWQPYDPAAIDLAHRHAGMSALHLLGTDQLGRDLLSRLLVGGWRTAILLVTVGVISFFGGCSLGGLAALAGGRVEWSIVRLAQFAIAMPTLIVALTATALFGLTPIIAGLALGLSGLGPYALLAHSIVSRTLREPYILAIRVLGAKPSRVLLRHVAPNCAPILLAHIGANAGQYILAYASLAFIGLGADTSQPDWGAMLFEYRNFVFDDPALMIWPGVAIALCALLLNTTLDRDDPVRPASRDKSVLPLPP